MSAGKLKLPNCEVHQEPQAAAWTDQDLIWLVVGGGLGNARSDRQCNRCPFTTLQECALALEQLL